MLSNQSGWLGTAELPAGLFALRWPQPDTCCLIRPAWATTSTRAELLARGAIRLLLDAVYLCCRARCPIWRVISTKLVTLLPADLRSKANSAPIRPTSDNAARRTACKPTSSSRQPPPSSSGLRSGAPTPTSCPSFLMSCRRVRGPHIRLCRCLWKNVVLVYNTQICSTVGQLEGALQFERRGDCDVIFAYSELIGPGELQPPPRTIQPSSRIFQFTA